jgi:hypothetical protein
MGNKRIWSATPIQVKGEGEAIVEHSTQERVKQTTFAKIHNKQYTMPGEVPICNDKWFNKFSYASNTPALRAVLDGKYVTPQDSDKATQDLFDEIAAIRRRVSKDSVSVSFTPNQWKRYWKAVNKETSSSESGIHLGHYIVGCKSTNISHHHAARVTVVIVHAIQLERWSWGLSLMLEKTMGNILVTKLQAILLMEANFNATNKIVYGNGMLHNAREHNLMPEEFFSEKNRMANNGTLCMTLFYDITRQVRVPAATALVDTSNCYDRIAHTMASLVFQALRVLITAVESMLATIENMKFVLLTGFGDSMSFGGGGVSIKTQGMCQRNGALPVAWTVISICILKAHGRKGHSAKFVCPITKLEKHLSVILYVDDTDLPQIDPIKNKTRCIWPFRRVSTAEEISLLPRVEHYNQASASTPLCPLIGSMVHGSTNGTHRRGSLG